MFLENCTAEKFILMFYEFLDDEIIMQNHIMRTLSATDIAFFKAASIIVSICGF